ncbi:protein-glutamate O-methyltransferase CheR [Methylosinus sp. Sm6]|uniref:CheR family methyltransferase n=1 Tax=Methylosinus sp. Sm6 TaxID=2866948 RepID=UPI001C990E45|nr:protein-glutamate O-methyltransferase [Methylosinus sp. Sm6]MBY6240575.1 protein-glutamate O-methyltransferase [Methylosinus sp. Sm6]
MRSSTAPAGRAIVPGEFLLTEADFRKIATLLHEDAGIHLPDTKATLVYSRLAKRLRTLGLESFRDYCALVASEAGVDERQQMLAALTTNVTRFFREPHHFKHLEELVLAPRAAAVRKGARMRIWSSACSNGQEPYSIAMSVLSVIPEAARLDVKILATDIDPNMVAAGIEGVYGPDVMEAVPPRLKTRWFTPLTADGRGDWGVGEELASLVSFRELNLIGRWPMSGRFDAIFCRNVAIYFEDKTQEALWSRYVDLLQPDGRLYIGHSERISGAAAASFESDGVTTYRLRSRGRG